MSSAPITPSQSAQRVHARQARISEYGKQKSSRLWSNLQEICQLLHIPAASDAYNEEHQFQHVHFKAGQRVHTIGQPFDALYIVSSGFLKTVFIDEFGNEQVLSFPMRGDLFGVDGIHSRRYMSEAVALSDCDVILIPFKKFTAIGHAYPELEYALYSVMSRELVREQTMVSMLGALSAEARVARFVVSLSERYAEMGYSSKTFNLRMTRQEIGSYLGLTLETVSRTLSAFNEIGLIIVDQRSITVNDFDALKNLRRLPPARNRTLASSKEAKASETHRTDSDDQNDWGCLATA